MTVEKDYTIFTKVQFLRNVQSTINSIFEKENIKQSKIELKISTRMTRTRGQFEYSRKYNPATKNYVYNPICLKFSDELLNGTYTAEFVQMVVIHEIIHYLVFVKGYTKETHGRIFQNHCRIHGCWLTTQCSEGVYSSLSKEDNKETQSQTRKRVATKKSKYTIYCTFCGFDTARTRTSSVTKNINNYRCPKCKGKLNVKQNF